MRPLGNRVVVRIMDTQATTKGGLVLPSDKELNYRRGQVVETGSGRQLESGTELENRVEVGAEVLFNKHAGIEFNHLGVTYRVIDEGELLVEMKSAQEVTASLT